VFLDKRGALQMSGAHITNHQVRLFMQSKQHGKTIKVAAAQAGFSERSAYRIQNPERNLKAKNRQWKTRQDPFEGVWETDLVPLLESEPKLEARTLLEELQKRYPEEYPDKQLRTFTDANELKITIRGESFSHRLYHFRLVFSGWEFAQIVQGGESYTALAEGMQNAFWSIGAVTVTHRTDSLSAAYKNLSDKTKEEFTDAYMELCKHYGTEPTRNNKGVSHENGSIESPNRHLKNRLDQALMLRGSREFDSLDEYRGFLRELLHRQNKRIEKAFIEEKTFLKALPERKTCDYEEERARVTTSSTIAIKHIIYTVPSKLIGMMLKVHLYDDRLECYVGGDHVITLKRLRGERKWQRNIDYRHIIGTLVRKPQAFRNYIYRDALFPTFAFRQAWEYLERELDSRQACREYVKILNEAARPNGENRVNEYLEECLTKGSLPKSDEVIALFRTTLQQAPLLKGCIAELSDYDALLTGQGGNL